MVRTVFGIDNNDIRSSWRNRNEVRMRNLEAITPGHSEFVRLERHRSVKFANGLDDHTKGYNGTDF